MDYTIPQTRKEKKQNKEKKTPYNTKHVRKIEDLLGRKNILNNVK